jgi:hypothetical protein
MINARVLCTGSVPLASVEVVVYGTCAPDSTLQYYREYIKFAAPLAALHKGVFHPHRTLAAHDAGSTYDRATNANIQAALRG